VEYVTGALLVALIGRCPWDYSSSPWNVNGLIRLDYAPFWWMCGWLYEPLGALIRRVHIRPEAPEPEPEAEPEPVAKPALSVAPPPPPPEPEPEQEPAVEPEVVVPLVRHDSTPREWNVWDLERIASEQEGRSPALDEERTLLLMSLRQFANASGDLPVDFDPLIRDAFGAALDELRLQELR